MPAVGRIRALAELLSRPVRFTARELWTPIAMWRTNSTIRRRAVGTGGPIATLKDDDLAKLIEAEWTRAKELDDKLQKLTAALSVSVTVGGLVGSTMLQDLAASGWKIAAAILFLLAAALLLTGVLIGFSGLRPKPRYGYGAGYLSIVAAGGNAARTEMIAAARSFERDNLLRANEAFAAVISIRNGVLAFASAVLLGLVAAGLGKATVSGGTRSASDIQHSADHGSRTRGADPKATISSVSKAQGSMPPACRYYELGRPADRTRSGDHPAKPPCGEADRAARTS